MRQPLPDDFARRRANSKFVSPRAHASNPGDYRVHWGQYNRAFPGFISQIFLKLLLSLSHSLSAQAIEKIAFFVATSSEALKMRKVQDHFSFGNTLPGIIVSQNPPLIAVMTDLTQGIGHFNAVKVLEQPLGACGLGDAPVGTRVAAVALYYDTGLKVRWGDFRPILLNAATRDEAALAHAMSSFSEEDWRELEDALATLTSPPPSGLHPIGWK